MPFRMSPMFTVVPVMVTIVFVLLAGVVVVRAVQSLCAWKRNNASPVLEVEARVVAKRTEVRLRRHHSADGIGLDRMSSATRYYVTFELQRSSRMELRVPDADYGMLAEGDEGVLTFQGTRFLGFGRR